MGLRKDWIRRVLSDAINDREEFLQSVAGIATMERDANRDLAESRALLARYDGGARVSLSTADLRVVRIACRHALIWREGYLDAVSNQPEAVKAEARNRIRHAKAVLSGAGGRTDDQLFANARSVSVYDLARGIGTEMCTAIRVVRDGDVETREVSDRGKALGRIETDADGIVRVTLADGKIINEPFEDAFSAQQWLLARYSDNLIFSIGRHVPDSDEEDDAPAVPGM